MVVVGGEVGGWGGAEFISQSHNCSLRRPRGGEGGGVCRAPVFGSLPCSQASRCLMQCAGGRGGGGVSLSLTGSRRSLLRPVTRQYFRKESEVTHQRRWFEKKKIPL